MNDDVSGVAERMVDEFVHLPWTAVEEVVCACAEECEFASPYFLEQAARARLRLNAPGARTRPATA